MVAYDFEKVPLMIATRVAIDASEHSPEQIAAMVSKVIAGDKVGAGG